MNLFTVQAETGPEQPRTPPNPSCRHLSPQSQIIPTPLVPTRPHNHELHVRAADHHLSVAVVGNEARVATNNGDLGRLHKGPLAVGSVGEGVVEVCATSGEDEDLVVQRDRTAKGGIDVGADVDFERGVLHAWLATEAGVDVAGHAVEELLIPDTGFLVAEDDADFGVEVGLAADGGRGHDARGGQEEGSGADEELHCVLRFVWFEEGL